MGMRGKGGRRSTVESHPAFAEIELALANDISTLKLAEKYGMSDDALWRHKKKMTPERKAMLRYQRTGESPLDLQRLKESEAELSVQRNIVMLTELYAAWRLAVDSEDWRSAASLANQHFKYAELQAKLVGELIQGDRHLHLNVTDSPQYRRLVALLMAWAGDKPDLLTELSEFFAENDPEIQAARLEAMPNGHDAFTC